MENFMKAPIVPHDESSRLEILRALDILDTVAEERFDCLTRLAKKLFGAPLALISLVDANRQWFKSCQGLDASETPRDISFCGHAILGTDVFVIEDALRDERFAGNPLVVGEPHIRFYAGVPLSVDGFRLGTLCVIDTVPRVCADEELGLLRDLAHMVERELTAMRLAIADELTSLSSRRGFLMLASHALDVCKRLDKPAALLFIDMDGFKDINDRFGHAEGDRALVQFSHLLQKTFRDADVVGRLGGDEFAVFLTNADSLEARVLAERLSIRVAEHNRADDCRGYAIRYSMGCVAYDPRKHDAIQDLLSDGDQSMYDQKRTKTRRVGHG